MNFILGTATFGTRYGIANKSNALTDLEALEILQEAESLGVEFLDTAPTYGRAEELIGDFHRSAKTFEVVSKFSNVYDFSSTRLISEIRESISRLGIAKFSAILFHRAEMLMNQPKLVVNQAIEDILGTGLVGMLGVSVYEEEEIRFISENFPTVTLFQVPENIMDRRLLESDLVLKLASQGFKFQVRSLFLQGLLLMESESLPPALSEAKFGLGQLERYCALNGVSVLDACINYALGIEWASSVVFGVNSKRQLQDFFKRQKFDVEFDNLPGPFPKALLDPRRWSFK